MFRPALRPIALTCLLALMLASRPGGAQSADSPLGDSPSGAPTDLERMLDTYVKQSLTTDDPILMAAAGETMPAGEAARLEGRLLTSPNDLEAHARLLGYYQAKQDPTIGDRKARLEHIRWIVSHKPETAIAMSRYTQLDPDRDRDAALQIEPLWVEAVQKNLRNAAVLRHAADFMMLHDPVQARRLLEMGKRLQPTSPGWSRRLGLVSLIDARKARGAARIRYGKQALADYEDEMRLLTDPEDRMDLLDEAGQAALAAGADDKAQVFASALLELTAKFPDHPGRHQAVHDAQTILGRLAVKQGDLAAARRCLMASLDFAPTDAPRELQPDMSLAYALLAKGDRQPVQQFLNRCAALPNADRPSIASWRTSIEQNLMPEAWHVQFGD